jgi:23S rRNA (guanosine2251-2'-O)-methyltransferase
MRKLKVEELGRMTVEAYKEHQKIPLVVVLDNVRSAHNVGAIFRTADAFAIQEIVLCGICAVPPNKEIHKTALGATESVQWRYFEQPAEAAKALLDEGYELWAVEQTDSSVVLNNWKNESDRPVAVVFGHEVDGVSNEMLEKCRGAIELPQYGTKHSLNVSVCAGIVMWELGQDILPR